MGDDIGWMLPDAGPASYNLEQVIAQVQAMKSTHRASE